MISIVLPVAKAVAVLELPVNVAVTVPALKFPLASRATMALAVFADAAVVAELLTFDAVAIVASLVSSMAADAFMSALTITPAAIAVALPTDVMSPVKLALVVTLPAVKPAAVPVTFVITPDEGVPKAGVTSVGLVANTAAPVPVSSVRVAARLALEGVARNVATFVPNPLMPVATGNPVALVRVADAGVPKTGVTKVGEVDRTVLPVPVLVVTPVPPLTTGNTPVISAVDRLMASQDELVPSVCRYLLAWLVCTGSKALRPALAVVCPVPPRLTGTVVKLIVEPVISIGLVALYWITPTGPTVWVVPLV